MTAVARVDGVALHEVGEELAEEELRLRAFTELLCAQELRRRSWATALRRYLGELAEKAEIEGAEIGVAQ